MERENDILELLDYIDPSMLNYQDWVNVGMALKHEGYSALDWDKWSSRDTDRYHPGECEKKWNTFNEGTISIVTGGTIVKMAKDNGWMPPHHNVEDYELDWDSSIDDHVIIDKDWIEEKEIKEPYSWSPVNQIIQYLELLFSSTDYVGYVTNTWEKDGKYMPTKGAYTQTAGELIQKLSKCKDDDIGSVIGDYNENAGAWIRFNPLDGKGVTNSNVTEYKYALVESDNMELAKQNAIIRELELPVACLVHSGKKSIHAIVKVDAADYYEYKKRVDYLYMICRKNGLDVDTQNKNPSRLSRMPGIMRNGHKQFIIDKNIGKSSWDEWKEWIESVNDDLPDPENLQEFWNDLPELSPPLIEGVLRQGHKMLLAGPSKAGKSFALIELCIAIAEGGKWFDWQCAKGKIMYVNLELDRASCLHRFKDVYQALNKRPDSLRNIDIWNLRGKSIPMDKLAPKLIRRAAKKNYIAVIIDPIYKVITGDENSADQMANFCNQFDKICNELGTSVIYCHHHSKGSQGSKRSMDRASGSGVFARDPDALLDLIELELNEDIYTHLRNKVGCETCVEYLDKNVPGWRNDASEDDMMSQAMMIDFCKKKLGKTRYYRDLENLIYKNKEKVTTLSAWRIEGTLREFPKFNPINLYFDYPIHKIDNTGVLKDIDPDNLKPQWQKAKEQRKTPGERKHDRKKSLEVAIQACNFEGEVAVEEVAEYLGVTERTVRRRVNEHSKFDIENNLIIRK